MSGDSHSNNRRGGNSLTLNSSNNKLGGNGAKVIKIETIMEEDDA